MPHFRSALSLTANQEVNGSLFLVTVHTNINDVGVGGWGVGEGKSKFSFFASLFPASLFSSASILSHFARRAPTISFSCIGSYYDSGVIITPQ